MAYQSAKAAETLKAAMGGGSSPAPSQGGSVRQATNNALGGAQPLPPAPKSGGSSGMDKFFDMLGAGGAAYQMSGAEFGASQERRAAKKETATKEANRKDLFTAKSFLDRGDKKGLMAHLKSRINAGEALGMKMDETRLIHTAALNDPTFVKAANLINDSFNYLVATDKIKPLGLTEQQKITNKMALRKITNSENDAKALRQEKARKDNRQKSPSANVMSSVKAAMLNLRSPDSNDNLFGKDDNKFLDPAQGGAMQRFVAATYEDLLNKGMRSDEAMNEATALAMTGVTMVDEGMYAIGTDSFAFSEPKQESNSGGGAPNSGGGAPNSGKDKTVNGDELYNVKVVKKGN